MHAGHDALRAESSTRKARIAQHEPGPEDRRQVDREEDVCEQRVADADVRRDGAAQVASQQQSAEDRGRRDDVGEDAEEQGQAETEHEVSRIAQLGGAVEDRLQPQEFSEGVEEQEERRDGAEHAAGYELTGGRPVDGRDCAGKCVRRQGHVHVSHLP